MINLAVFFFLPYCLGALVVAAASIKNPNSFNPWEKAALSFPLGLGLLAMTMYLLDLSSIPVTLTNIGLAVLAYDAGLLVYLHLNKALKRPTLSFSKPSFDLDWQEWALFILITLKSSFIFFSALVKPMIDVDAFIFYSIVAKALYFKHTAFSLYGSQLFMHKTPLPFFAQGWVLIGLQTANDNWLKIISPLLLLSLLIIFYNILRRSQSRKLSLFFTFLLSSLPFIVYHATTAYADVPQTFYFTASALYLGRFLKDFSERPPERDYAPLLISFIFAAITIWAKNAGLMLAGANILALLLFLFLEKRQLSAKDIRNVALAFVLLLVLVMPLIVPRMNFFVGMVRGVAGHQDPNTLAVVKNAAQIPLVEKTRTISQIFVNKLFFYGDWQLAWALLVISLLFFYRQALAVPQRYLLGILVLATMTVFVQFESSGTFVWLLDGTLLDRLIMNEVPLALFVSAQAIIPGLTALNVLTGASGKIKSLSAPSR
ncbi:MAG: hypothetical protein WC601_00510 [Desulfotomaculaceae bacterium]